MKEMEVGDSVIFKRKVRDRGTHKFCIGGWQGRISKIVGSRIFYGEEEELLYIIEYDSITLKQMSEDFIMKNLEKRYDFRYFIADMKHFEPATARDTPMNVKGVWMELECKYHYESVLKKKKEDKYSEYVLNDEDDESQNEGVGMIKDGNLVYIFENPISDAEKLAIREDCIQRNKHNFKIGDVVKIKQGVTDYIIDGFDFGGWHGRISYIEGPLEDDKRPTDLIVVIRYDSITLQQMPEAFILEYLDKLSDFRNTDLFICDIEPAMSRDTIDDVLAARLELDKKYDYSSILDLDDDEPEVLLNMDSIDCN